MSFQTTFDFSDWEKTPFPGTRAWCFQHYRDIENAPIPLDTKIETALIVVFAIWIEILAHATIGPYVDAKHNAGEDMESASGEIVDEQPRNEHLTIPWQPTRWSSETLRAATQLQPSRTARLSGPASPAVRAARLTMATFFYTSIVGCFVLRMMDLARPQTFLYGCQDYVHVPRPNYAAITFLQIMPFICATSAFLRALVDCVLLWWSKGLHYRLQGSGLFKSWHDEDGCVWLPCMPLVGMVTGVGLLVTGFWGLVMLPFVFATGDKELSVFTSKTRVQKVKEESGKANSHAEGRGLLSEDEDEETLSILSCDSDADTLGSKSEAVGVGKKNDDL